MSCARHEPPLGDILSDPIVTALMRADCVDSPALHAMLRALAESLHADGGAPVKPTILPNALAGGCAGHPGERAPSR